MYKKIIRKGDNEYSYYYTNIRKEGKVKNIFLSSDKEEAIKLEGDIKGRNIIVSQPELSGASKSSVNNEDRFINLNLLFLITLFIILITILLIVTSI